MTLALSGYSAVFMRYSMMVSPRNYLLFGCHIVNFGAQMTQGYRYVNYWNLGGREASLSAKAKEGLSQAEGGLDKAVSQAEGLFNDAAGNVKSKAEELAGQAKAQANKISR